MERLRTMYTVHGCPCPITSGCCRLSCVLVSGSLIGLRHGLATVAVTEQPAQALQHVLTLQIPQKVDNWRYTLELQNLGSAIQASVPRC